MSNILRSLLVFFVFAASLHAAEAPADLAIQARSILKKHCAECHDGQPGNRSSLVLLDHSQLTDSKRKLPAFVKSKNAAASQVVQFIEDGSMPPGNRPKVSADEAAILKAWIDAGAVAYPRRYDDAYIIATILSDITAAGPAERKFYRYFTLHHLIDDKPGLVSLADSRNDLRKAINQTARNPLGALKAIDGTETIFRIDTRELGWDRTPFRLLDRNGKDLPSPFSVFDTLLLEYPLGEMPAATPDMERLVELWLRPIEQVRPIVYVRADWFSDAVKNPLLSSDLTRLANSGVKGRGANAPDPKGIDLHREDLPNIKLPAPTKAIAIVPIDAWYAGDFDPPVPAPKVEITISDAAGKKSAKFKPGDKLTLSIRSSENVFIELIQIDSEGSVFAHDLGAGGRVQANVPKSVDLPLGDDVGKQRFVLFAAVEKFAPGDLLQAKTDGLPVERYVHRFYELPPKLGDPLRFDPAKMVRKSATIEVSK